jgi:hypothetical protein
MTGKLVIPRGPLTPLGVMISGGLFGVGLATQLFTHLWLIGVFGVLMLAITFCFTGIEFDTEKKLYREYYRLLFFKLGNWQSYQEYKYVSVQGVILTGTTDLPQMPFTGKRNDQTAKIMLLNEQHNKKLLVMYSKKPEKVNDIIKELTVNLKLPFAKYNPPISEATLRRKRNRGVR